MRQPGHRYSSVNSTIHHRAQKRVRGGQRAANPGSQSTGVFPPLPDDMPATAGLGLLAATRRSRLCRTGRRRARSQPGASASGGSPRRCRNWFDSRCWPVLPPRVRASAWPARHRPSAGVRPGTGERTGGGGAVRVAAVCIRWPVRLARTACGTPAVPDSFSPRGWTKTAEAGRSDRDASRPVCRRGVRPGPHRRGVAPALACSRATIRP